MRAALALPVPGPRTPLNRESEAANSAMMSAVRSVEASSTTMTSMSRSVWAAMLAKVFASRASPFRTGTITETAGASASACGSTAARRPVPN